MFTDENTYGAHLETYPSKNTDAAFLDSNLAAAAKRNGSALRLYATSEPSMRSNP